MGLKDRLYSHWEVGSAVMSAEHRFLASGFEAGSARCLPRPDSDDPVYPDTHTVKAEVVFTIPHGYKLVREDDKLPNEVYRALNDAQLTGKLFCAAEEGASHFEILGGRTVEILPENSAIVAITVRIHLPANGKVVPVNEIPKRDPKWV